MQPISPKRRPALFPAFRAALLLVAAAAFGACDRHSAEEVPENYGHGSSHERTVPDHQIDSKVGSKSFSDTAGTKDEEAGESHSEKTGSPTPTPGGHFY